MDAEDIDQDAIYFAVDNTIDNLPAGTLKAPLKWEKHGCLLTLTLADGNLATFELLYEEIEVRYQSIEFKVDDLRDTEDFVDAVKLAIDVVCRSIAPNLPERWR